MNPSDVIAEASVEDLERRNALLEGLCRRILDRIKVRQTIPGIYEPIIHVDLHDRWRKELDELTGGR